MPVLPPCCARVGGRWQRGRAVHAGLAADPDRPDAGALLARRGQRTRERHLGVTSAAARVLRSGCVSPRNQRPGTRDGSKTAQPTCPASCPICASSVTLARRATQQIAPAPAVADPRCICRLWIQDQHHTEHHPAPTLPRGLRVRFLWARNARIAGWRPTCDLAVPEKTCHRCRRGGIHIVLVKL